MTLEHTATGWQGEAIVDTWIDNGSTKWFSVKARGFLLTAPRILTF